MRYYKTKQVNGGTTFQCTVCEHRVTTLDFDPTKGNRRTQAATAMNRHAAELHFSNPQAPAPIQPGNRGGF